MLAYFVILSLVMLVVLIEKYSINRKAFLLPLIFLVIFSTIRSEEVGADTKNYTLNFKENFSIEYYNLIDGIELGYQALEYTILFFTKEYFWLFFITSLIVVFSYLYILKKYSVNYTISIFTFICFGYYTFFFNGLRQGLAMAISSFAIIFLINREVFKYLLVIVFASFFHKSALILVPFYFIVNYNLKFLYKALILFFVSVIFSPVFINILSSSNERYSSYSSQSENSGGYLTLTFYFLIGLISYIFVFCRRNRDYVFDIIFQLYFLGILFIIPIAMMGASASGPQRLIFYFSWLSCLVIPYIFNTVKNKYLLFCYSIFCIIYFYLTTTRFSLLVPYSLNDLFRIF